MSVNKITKAMYPELWNTILDDYELINKEHRKYASFYCDVLVRIDENLQKEYFPDNPELIGNWMSDEPCYWSDANGLDDRPTSLVRVEEREKITVTKEWVRVT